MEQRPESFTQAERVNQPTLEDFEQFLQGLHSFPCKEKSVKVSNKEQMYFLWLADQLPLIDSVTLYDLYKRNVLDGSMKSADFKEYCYINKLLPRERTEAFKALQIDFEMLYTRRLIEMKETYESWAQAHDIDTRPGAYITVSDVTGATYNVCTDYENRGKFISS